jgi:glycosyltransferase involved in cell wall biosynthesis
MSAPPEVTVVVPTRFRPELLTRAVRSALAQTVADIEVLVVVDGPDEETHAALKELGDPRVRPIGLPERGGAPNARNVGAREAAAPWVAFLDDDDEWLPEKLRVQLDLAAGAGVPMPVVATRLISRTPRADSVMPRRLPAPGEPLSEYLTVRRGLFYGDGFIQTSTIMAPAVLARRVPFAVGLRRQQELDWTLRVLRQDGTALVYADRPLVLWHQDEDRDRISLESPWESQLDWLRHSRDLFTPRAYAAFTFSVLASMAATTRRAAVFRDLWREAHAHGRPAGLDYLTYLQIWALPPTVRRRVRDLVLGRVR